MYPLLQYIKLGQRQLASPALIGEGGIGKTVGDDPVTARQRRLNDLRQVLATASKHQQGLGLKVHFLMQQDLAQTSTESGATRLASGHNGQAACAQLLRHETNMGRFAGTVDAFKGNEFA